MHAAGRKVVLHVGAHRTGATVVQHYLDSHQGALHRRRVHYVTRTALTPLVGWGELVVQHPELLGGLLDEFARSRRYRTLLASHENICGHPFRPGTPGLYPSAGAPIRTLRRLLDPFDARILLTVRPQHELVESFYLHKVQLGGRVPFATWLAGLDTDELSWTPLVRALRDAFGEDAVSVVDCAGITAGGPEFVRHLLGRAGVDVPVDASWAPPPDAGVSATGLRMALRGNAVLPDPADRARLRTFLQRHFSDAAGPRPVLLDDDTRAALRERYAAEYAALVGAPLASAS